MGIKVSRPEGHKSLLTKRRKWFDEFEGELESQQEEQADQKDTEETPPPEENLVNLHAVDDKGNRLFFERDYVTKLREESRLRKEEIARLKAAQQPQQKDEKKQQPAQTQDASGDDRYAQLEEKFNALLNRIEQQQKQSLVSVVGTSHSIPQELWHMLRGETAEELDENAALLAQYLKQKPGRPKTDLGAIPSSQPNTRTDANKRDEYFKKAESDPGIFRFDPKNLSFNGE